MFAFFIDIWRVIRETIVPTLVGKSQKKRHIMTNIKTQTKVYLYINVALGETNSIMCWPGKLHLQTGSVGW